VCIYICQKSVCTDFHYSKSSPYNLTFENCNIFIINSIRKSIKYLRYIYDLNIRFHVFTCNVSLVSTTEQDDNYEFHAADYHFPLFLNKKNNVQKATVGSPRMGRTSLQEYVAKIRSS
jgi:hypothetical protein